MSRIVIALGGNALGSSPSEQLNIVKKTAKNIVDIAELGNQIIITHGNGPQVGMIYNAMSTYAKVKGVEPMPFPECGAMSEGYIGYHLQQAIQYEIEKRHMRKKCITVATQVVVDKNDVAFDNPTKPIGEFLSKEEADKLSKVNNCIYKEDAGRGYRRVIASPEPLKIVELKTIMKMIEDKNIVIACGGGGIPVIEKNNGYKGIDAVIDKDKTSALLAKEINADILLILTAVKKVKINFNTKDEQDINVMSLSDAKMFIDEGQFAKGSMLPKVEACVSFIEKTRGNNKAIITSLSKARDALKGKTGTTIIRRSE